MGTLPREKAQHILTKPGKYHLPPAPQAAISPAQCFRLSQAVFWRGLAVTEQCGVRECSDLELGPFPRMVSKSSVLSLMSAVSSDTSGYLKSTQDLLARSDFFQCRFPFSTLKVLGSSFLGFFPLLCPIVWTETRGSWDSFSCTVKKQLKKPGCWPSAILLCSSHSRGPSVGHALTQSDCADPARWSVLSWAVAREGLCSGHLPPPFLFPKAPALCHCSAGGLLLPSSSHQEALPSF